MALLAKKIISRKEFNYHVLYFKRDVTIDGRTQFILQEYEYINSNVRKNKYNNKKLQIRSNS